MWQYRGKWPVVPKKLLTALHQQCIYVVAFSDRTKIGIAADARERVKTLSWEHAKLADQIPTEIAVTLPNPRAREIEQQVLRQFTPQRLKGEYLSVAFGTVCAAIETTLNHQTAGTATMGEALGAAPARPRLYRTARTDTPYQVTWVRADLPRRSGRRLRTVKWFANEADAQNFLKAATEMWQAGLLDEQTDVATALNLMRGTGVSLTELAQKYLLGRR